MIVLRLALLTCGFYLLIAVITEVGLRVAGRLTGGIMYFGTGWGWGVFFFIVWLVSFSLAYRMYDAAFRLGL